MASKGAKRRFLSVKSSLAELIPKDFGNNVSLPHPKYIFGELHPSIRDLAVAFGVYLGVGTVCFYIFLHDIKGNKENPVIDALYFTVTTMTSVGYGDLVPNETRIKVLCCLFVLAGMGIVGLVMSKAAEYLVEKQEILVVKALSKYQKYGPSKFTTEDLETEKISFKCLVVSGVLGVLMLFGAIFLYIVEELDFIDSIYCVCTTVATVGYGDKAFATLFGRIFAVVWILTTTLGFGQVFMYLIELVTEKKQKALAHWIVDRKMTNLYLNSADIDGDVVAEVAEFAVNKLKAMGKISQEDISRLMKEFEDLDVHKCGYLASHLVRAR